jgi:hypothetical protein
MEWRHDLNRLGYTVAMSVSFLLIATVIAAPVLR